MDKSTLPKSVYMLHNLTHVELNAVDLAWDTVVRFSAFGLPADFYSDFARVADDESRHLSWCLQRLEELGFEYGCMPAHDLLWEGCQLSQHDLGARLAVVPMGQEARGLDAGDRLAKRLVGMGDNRTAAIVRRIATEERAHVAVGVAWFSRICAALGVEPGPSFQKLLLTLTPGLLKGPYNDAERQEVGLPQQWYFTALWEPDLRQAAAEVLAAAERGGQPAPLPASMRSGTALAPVREPEKLRQLAARLAAVLDLELAASRPA